MTQLQPGQYVALCYPHKHTQRCISTAWTMPAPVYSDSITGRLWLYWDPLFKCTHNSFHCCVCVCTMCWRLALSHRALWSRPFSVQILHSHTVCSSFIESIMLQCNWQTSVVDLVHIAVYFFCNVIHIGDLYI